MEVMNEHRKRLREESANKLASVSSDDETDETNKRHKIDIPNKIESQTASKKCLHNSTINMYSTLRSSFMELMSGFSSTIPKLGEVQWECNINPEEKMHQITPESANRYFHQTIQCIQHIYGVPVFCCGTSKQNSSTRNQLISVSSSTTHKEFTIPLENICDADALHLKRAAKQTPSALEVTNFKFLYTSSYGGQHSNPLPGFASEDTRIVIERTFNSGSITLHPQKICIYENGTRFQPNDFVSQNRIGTLLILFPSDYDGGELIIDDEITYRIPHYSGPEYPWVAFRYGCPIEMSPVISGACVALVCSIEADIDVDYMEPYYGALKVIVGPPERQLQQQALGSIGATLRKLPHSSIGLLIDSDYKEDTSLESLEGMDKVLVEKLKSEGFSVKLTSVVYRSHTEFLCSKQYGTSGHKRVFSWTKQDEERVMKGLKLPQEEKLMNIPFFRVGDLGTAFQTEEKDEDKVIENTALYWTAALLIEQPTWWTFARFLLIAKMKNSAQECNLACLPPEILKEIVKLFRAQFQIDHPKPPEKPLYYY